MKTSDILNREPWIAGIRIGVLDLAELVLDCRYTPADTADQLALAVVAIYHSLAYYNDHPKQMRNLYQERREAEAVPTTQPSSRQHSHSDRVLHR